MTGVQNSDLNRVSAYRLDWDRFDGAVVLVTGATGFIGSFVVRAILLNAKVNQRETKVLALVRNAERARALLGPEEKRIVFLEGDVTVPIRYQGHIDYVIHCASNAAPDRYMNDPTGTMKINFCGTLNSLECARACGAKRYLYVSTIEVFGRTEGGSLLEEDSFGYIPSASIRSCYPESKKCCETLAVCFGKQYSMDVVIGRLSYIYGAGMSRTDTKVCALFARAAANGQDIVLKSRAGQKRSYTYISDAVTGLLTVLLRGEAGKAYNIASPESVVTIAEMAEMHCRLFPEKEIQVRFELPKEEEKQAFSYMGDAVMDPRKLMALGWRPEVALEQGIALAVRHEMERNDA